MPKRFKKGDPLKISAYAWNRMLDMVGFDVDQNSDWRKGAFHTDWLFCKVSHTVDDVSALPDGILPRGSPVCVSKPEDLTGVEEVEYQINPQDFIHKAEFVAMESPNFDILGITMEPINLNTGQSSIGRVARNGLVYANIELGGAPLSEADDLYRSIYRYVHPYPYSNPKYRTTLQVNSSGVAQILGDSIVLGRNQPLYKYEVKRSGNGRATVVDVYGIDDDGTEGYLVVEDAQLYHSARTKVHTLTGNAGWRHFIPGAVGLCMRGYAGFVEVTSNSLNMIGVTDDPGSARVGNQPGGGLVKAYYLDKSALPHTLQPILDSDGDEVYTPFYNSSGSTVGADKWVQLKDVQGDYWIDVEDCPT